jgi:hypothetical protein
MTPFNGIDRRQGVEALLMLVLVALILVLLFIFF